MHATQELLHRYDRPGPRYTSYPTAVEFHEGFGADDYALRLQALAAREDPLSLYVHLPFCRERCLYCACNVVISPHGKAADPYLARLHREIDLVAQHLGPRKKCVSQLHFGGGTPTYYGPEALRALMERLRANFAWDSTAELAMELDPRVTTRAHLEALAAEGFNRVSLGVQDLDPEVQAVIGRVQPVALTEALIEDARALGIGSVNIDLIYGLPKQTLASFRETLAQVARMRPERLAIYGFAYVPWLQGHQKKLPQEAMPGPAERVALLALASEVLTEAGYLHIGMDHFALPDSDLCEARAQGRLWRNFMGYTTSRAPDMIGFGLSSIGYVSGAYVQNHKKLSSWQAALDAGRLPVERGLPLTDDDKLRAHVIRELMCNLVLDPREVEARYEVNFWETFGDALPDLEEMEREGLIRRDGALLRVTELGQVFVRNVAMLFDGYLQRRRQDRPVFSRTV
jgi:oxygen-independent coproporphyrinogen-3 oxidase